MLNISMFYMFIFVYIGLRICVCFFVLLNVAVCLYVFDSPSASEGVCLDVGVCIRVCVSVCGRLSAVCLSLYFCL